MTRGSAFPRPLPQWAYPREFKSKDAAGQMRRSPYMFSGIGSLSPTLWLARGYAVLDGPSMPVVGDGDAEPNDTYIEQLTASARAAVKALVDRGVGDPDRIAVGGHSYGAFMTANLLAHCGELFACGIARCLAEADPSPARNPARGPPTHSAHARHAQVASTQT